MMHLKITHTHIPQLFSLIKCCYTLGVYLHPTGQKINTANSVITSEASLATNSEVTDRSKNDEKKLITM